MYDITNRESFNNITNWISEAKAHSSENIKFIIVGNKSDLIKERKISYEEGFNFSKQNGFDFFETSAKNFSNIDKVFYFLSKKILGFIENGKIDPKVEFGIKIGGFNKKKFVQIEEITKKKKKGKVCC